MTKWMGVIEQFVKQVRTRLNRHLWLDIAFKSVVVALAFFIGIGLVYVVHGYRVPEWWLALVLVPALLIGLGCWVFFLHSTDDAAKYADKHFGLKDTLRSYCGFAKAHKQGELYDLQAAHAEAILEQVSPKQVRYRWPRRLMALCGVLILSSVLLALKADSPGVLSARALAQEVLINTEDFNQQLKEALEQLKDEAQQDDIQDLIEPDALQKMVDELKQTSDLKEAMRQYAKLEQGLNKVLSKLEQRKDEQLYKRLGKALEEVPEARALSKPLQEQQYKQAADELQKLKIDKKAPPQQQQKQLERIKEIAKRMANEAQRNSTPNRTPCKAAQLAQKLNRAASNAAQAGKSGQSSMSRGSQGSQSKQSSGSGSGSNSPGSQGMVSEGASSDGSGSDGEQGVNECLGEMGKNLSDLHAKCKAKSMIKKLCDSLSQCQGKMGQCNGSGQSDQWGRSQSESAGQGAGIGMGSSANANADINNDPIEGQKSMLQGTKGTGSSTKTTETASDGSGSSGAGEARLIEQYQRQAESFVRREDVSEAVKSGVKAYFENIHATEEQE